MALELDIFCSLGVLPLASRMNAASDVGCSWQVSGLTLRIVLLRMGILVCTKGSEENSSCRMAI